jgi:hypothetical protein
MPDNTLVPELRECAAITLQCIEMITTWPTESTAPDVAMLRYTLKRYDALTRAQRAYSSLASSVYWHVRTHKSDAP